MAAIVSQLTVAKARFLEGRYSRVMINLGRDLQDVIWVNGETKASV